MSSSTDKVQLPAPVQALLDPSIHPPALDSAGQGYPGQRAHAVAVMIVNSAALCIAMSYAAAETKPILPYCTLANSSSPRKLPPLRMNACPIDAGGLARRELGDDSAADKPAAQAARDRCPHQPTGLKP
ncbi:hypothetical protein GQ53DRAFT_235960 [Thozetella sp. PMI_491]|nr:hypothetical protein GQ53DRAFT_235960 [Thozetella sp. PMI_491]